ncbi:MAG: Gfo/Idh/MocA family oxidoreductase [Propionibacteriaceae bacterium]|jgi:myo-inositol 2-dehydrogenase/D-chiro-inositol 1-dehydrogenase|nr:Gfo/Idh/MocA family oxidoreductase [Propionibacteriaceae bacterium]
MSATLRIGVIGVGRIGLSHAAAVKAQPAVSQLLVADADTARAEAAAARLGAVAVSVGDLISQADGVVIATSTSTHADLLLAAAAARRPVFCEKPVALDIPTTRAVLAQVKASGVPVQIGFQRRFDAGYQAARAAVRSGTLGELRRAHLLTCDAAPPPAEFIPGSGGLFKDCGIHDIDALRWVLGREVTETTAYGAARGAGFFAAAGDVSEAAGLLRLDDGTLATLQLSRYNGQGYDVRMEIAGVSGSIAVGLDAHTALRSAEPGVVFPDGKAHLAFYPRFEAAYRAELAAFIDVAAGLTASPASVEDALEALYVCEALRLSCAEGRPVAVDEVRRDF